MPARCWIVPLLALAASAAARPLPAQLEVPPPQPAPTAVIVQQGPVTLERAIEMASSRHDGQVARARTTTRGGRRVHEITILGEDQRVRIVRIDAETGRFL